MGCIHVEGISLDALKKSFASLRSFAVFAFSVRCRRCVFCPVSVNNSDLTPAHAAEPAQRSEPGQQECVVLRFGNGGRLDVVAVDRRGGVELDTAGRLTDDKDARCLTKNVTGLDRCLT